MAEIKFTVRYEDKESVHTTDPETMVLGNMIEQLVNMGFLPAGQQFMVKKAKSDDDLDQDKTLAQCGVVDNDILDINLAGKAGSI
ncbi:MAG: hypothetical protein IJK59_05240 [Firmicutes bacterium]|nr:hypothetical protein [Bacillota bacterium]MBR0523022.1 hypothetical protein [Bacillota bacterium]